MSDRKLRQKEDYYGKLNYGSTFTLPDLNKKSRSINNATIQHSSYPILPLDLKIRKFETFLVKSLVSITNSTNDTRKKSSSKVTVNSPLKIVFSDLENKLLPRCPRLFFFAFFNKRRYEYSQSPLKNISSPIIRRFDMSHCSKSPIFV